MFNNLSFEPTKLASLARRLKTIEAVGQTDPLFCQLADYQMLANGVDWLHLSIDGEGSLVLQPEPTGGYLLMVWQGNKSALFNQSAGTQLPIGQSSTLLINTQKPGSFSFEPASKGTLICSYLPTGWGTLPIPSTGLLSESMTVSTHFLLHSIRLLSEKSDTSALLSRLSYIYQLLHGVLDQLQQPLASGNLSEAKRYLFDNLDKPFPGLSFLADLSNTSVSTFKSRFQEQEQLSPGRFFILQRLRHAQELLSSGLTIKQVSDQLMYANVPSFTKAFKRQFGLSPVQYMRQIPAGTSSSDLPS